MTVSEVIKYFGTARKACALLGLAEQNMTYWKNVGYIPLRRQYEFQVITNGALQARIEDVYGAGIENNEISG